MYLVDIIKNLQNEKKSINDELFFGFLVSHSKYCLNSHCTAKIIRDIIYNNESTFSNEIDNFVITKSDFISYCKTSDTNDNFDMLQDMTKKKLTYTEAMAEVEQIVTRLKSEQIDVDTLTTEVKRATELIAQCKAQLFDVEQALKVELEK
jgi:exodeoxyribonuclease VII small subunit